MFTGARRSLLQSDSRPAPVIRDGQPDGYFGMLAEVFVQGRGGTSTVDWGSGAIQPIGMHLGGATR